VSIFTPKKVLWDRLQVFLISFNRTSLPLSERWWLLRGDASVHGLWMIWLARHFSLVHRSRSGSWRSTKNRLGDRFHTHRRDCRLVLGDGFRLRGEQGHGRGIVPARSRWRWRDVARGRFGLPWLSRSSSDCWKRRNELCWNDTALNAAGSHRSFGATLGQGNLIEGDNSVRLTFSF